MLAVVALLIIFVGRPSRRPRIDRSSGDTMPPLLPLPSCPSLPLLHFVVAAPALRHVMGTRTCAPVSRDRHVCCALFPPLPFAHSAARYLGLQDHRPAVAPTSLLCALLHTYVPGE